MPERAIEPPSDSNRCPTCGVLLHSGMQPCRPVEPPSDAIPLSLGAGWQGMTRADPSENRIEPPFISGNTWGQPKGGIPIGAVSPLISETLRPALRRIVLDWIDEGFTTPPYSSEVYDVFEALDIHGSIRNYNVDRPEADHD